MENYNRVVELAKEIVAQADKLGTKYTKSGSKQFRNTLGELKKVITPARAELVTKDKE